LLALCGRGRNEQLQLADRLGLRHYQSPGGGCLLTDAHFSVKLRDLFDHAPAERTGLDDVALLRIGRHFRVRPDLKIVLGRDRDENRRLQEFTGERRWIVEPVAFNGPTALVCGARDDVAAAEAAALIGRYTRAPEPHFEVRWDVPGGERRRSLGPASPTGAAVATAVP
jgi:hypothetical protein